MQNIGAAVARRERGCGRLPFLLLRVRRFAAKGFPAGTSGIIGASETTGIIAKPATFFSIGRAGVDDALVAARGSESVPVR